MSDAIPTAAPEINCRGCRFYETRHHIDQQALARALASGVAVAQGHCKAHPTPVAKMPADWCGEHQPRPREVL